MHFIDITISSISKSREDLLFKDEYFAWTAFFIISCHWWWNNSIFWTNTIVVTDKRRSLRESNYFRSIGMELQCRTCIQTHFITTRYNNHIFQNRLFLVKIESNIYIFVVYKNLGNRTLPRLYFHKCYETYFQTIFYHSLVVYCTNYTISKFLISYSIIAIKNNTSKMQHPLFAMYLL